MNAWPSRRSSCPSTATFLSMLFALSRFFFVFHSSSLFDLTPVSWIMLLDVLLTAVASLLLCPPPPPLLLPQKRERHPNGSAVGVDHRGPLQSARQHRTRHQSGVCGYLAIRPPNRPPAFFSFLSAFSECIPFCCVDPLYLQSRVRQTGRCCPSSCARAP